ncbi:hypothetical protein PF003_g14244 [Phytophthora fragariae]|nr:hypothetical protein PF003_g14244 [Phytophthora fragariae]
MCDCGVLAQLPDTTDRATSKVASEARQWTLRLRAKVLGT